MIWVIIGVYGIGLLLGLAGGYLVWGGNRSVSESEWWINYCAKFGDGTLYGSRVGELSDRLRNPKSSSKVPKFRIDPSKFNSYMRKGRDSSKEPDQ